MLAATLLVIVFLVRTLYVEHWLGHSVCIRAWREGPLALQLRRRVRMEQLPGHIAAFPVPREERILVRRLFGVMLWHREVSVALPLSACAHLETVGPEDFDRQFPAWLRLADAPRS